VPIFYSHHVDESVVQLQWSESCRCWSLFAWHCAQDRALWTASLSRSGNVILERVLLTVSLGCEYYYVAKFLLTFNQSTCCRSVDFLTHALMR